MPKPFNPKPGTPVTGRIRGVPLFHAGSSRRDSVVTSDVWEFLRHESAKKLSAKNAEKAIAFLDQAKDFYSSASEANQSSTPLLYYYAFMNLVTKLN